MKRILFSSVALLLLFPARLPGQRDSLRDVFMDAESWFLYEEYKEALPLYMGLHERDPENDYINYKIGVCLLNDPYQKERSIEFLMEAIDNIDPGYKENSFKETSAPPDALYHLGNAYLVNDKLDRAIETYGQFLEIMDPEVYDSTVVWTQIRACENAKRLKQMPVDIDLHRLDSLINTGYPDIQPVLSGNGEKMAFVTQLPFYDAAFFCEKTEGGWSYPELITQSLGFDENIYPVALSHDGTEMVLYYDDDFIGNLYYSTYQDGRWNPAVKLDDPISTKYWESHACFSRDGQTLYFTSNRKGGYGGLDIYRSERQPDGSWGAPENLGPTVNTRFNEETPFLTSDGNRLYFSSYGHYNMGGYDIFFSRRNPDGSWGDPVNLGYPVNTTDDDRFFKPVDNGDGGYYSMYKPGGMGGHDIYYMDIYSVDNPRMYFVSGHLRTADGLLDTTRHTIFVVDVVTGDTVIVTAPAEGTGAFGVELPRGEYRLHFTGAGYEELIRPLKITMETDKGGIVLRDDVELQPAEEQPLVFTGEESRIGLRDTAYEGAAGEILEVPLRRLERGSTLVTSIYQDSVLVSRDTLQIERRRTTLEITPPPGESRVVLEMTDRDGNIHRRELTATGTVERKRTEVELEKMREEARRAEEAAAPDTARTREVAPELRERILEEAKISTDGLGGLLDSLERTGRDANRLLGSIVSDGDVQQLYTDLLEHAKGPLKAYLEELDPATAGIRTAEGLIAHLEKAAESEGYVPADLREALLGILETYSGRTEEYPAVVEGEPEEDREPDREKGPGTLAAVLAAAGIAGLILLVFLIRRRRKKETDKRG